MHRVWGLVLPRPVEDWSPGLDSAGDSVSAVRRRQAAGRLGTSEKEQRPSSLTVGDVQKVCLRNGAVRRFESTGALLLVRFVRTC